MNWTLLSWKIGLLGTYSYCVPSSSVSFLSLQNTNLVKKRTTILKSGWSHKVELLAYNNLFLRFVGLVYLQGRRLVLKTTSATSETSRLINWGFFGVKTVVLPEKWQICLYFFFWLHFYNSRQTFEAKEINLCHGTVALVGAYLQHPKFFILICNILSFTSFQFHPQGFISIYTYYLSHSWDFILISSSETF